MSHINIESGVLYVGVYPLDHFLLLLHHVCQLGKYPAKLHWNDNSIILTILCNMFLLTYSALYRMHGIRSAGVVTVIVLAHHHLATHGASHVNNSIAATETIKMTI